MTNPGETKKQLAEAAVGEFENLRFNLITEKDNWADTYQDAAAELDSIRILEDECTVALNKAKPLVAAYGKTVGDFKATVRKTKPHYDENLMAAELCELDDENLGEVFKHLVKVGVISGVKLDKVALAAHFSQHPELTEAFEDAYDQGGQETVAVRVPKL